MSERFQQELARQKAYEEEEREKREQERLHTESVLSQIIEENQATAYTLNVSVKIFHKLASMPEVFKSLVHSTTSSSLSSDKTESSPTQLNAKPKRTQKTSRVTGATFVTTRWDKMFNPKNRGE